MNAWSGLEFLGERVVHVTWQATCLWKECHSSMQVGREVQLVESREASGPALFGLDSLWLLLPPGFAGRFTPAQQRHIFLHELAHLRRHDIAVHWIMALLQAIHWFNPFVWLAFARLRAARGEAADALALAPRKSRRRPRPLYPRPKPASNGRSSRMDPLSASRFAMP